MRYAEHMETDKTAMYELRTGNDRIPKRKRGGQVAMFPMRIGHGEQKDQSSTRAD